MILKPVVGSYCVTWLYEVPKRITLQKKIIRAISWSEYDANTKPLFHRFGLLAVTEFNEYHNACLMYQVVFRLNARLCELVPISCLGHSYATRKKANKIGKRRRLECTRHSVVYRGPKIWTKLDDNLRTVRSITIFMRKLKSYLLSTYE